MKNNLNIKIERNRSFANWSFLGIAILLFLIFSFQFYQIMVIGSFKNKNLRAEGVQTISQTTVIAAKRGTIYDRSGNTVAIDATSYSLYAILTDQWSKDDEKAKADYVQDFEHTATVLARYIEMSKEEIEAILQQDGLAQVEFGVAGANLPVTVKEAIEQEQLPGIKFNETPNRYYSNGVFASHHVGFTELEQPSNGSATGNVLVGKIGIESVYNDFLTGRNGEMSFQIDGQGYHIAGSETVQKVAQDGRDLYLTLDKRIQTYMETLVSGVNETYQPLAITAMLVEPSTGDVIATTQRPTFNATTKEGINDMWNNLLVDQAYEPGSTMKVLALAAAINEGLFDPDQRFQSGSIKIYDDVVKDYNLVGWGNITYLEGLAHSSNVAFVEIISKIGVERWKEYLDAFGFGKSTESGFANEVSGSNPYDSYLQQISTGFGQGITVTVYQMMQAFSAIANDGQMVKLRVVDRIQNEDSDQTTEQNIVKLKQVISKEAARKTLQYLNEAMYVPGATTTAYLNDQVELAVKTGTAEIINPETGIYYKGSSNYIFSVVGFLPAENPKYILYITIKQPQQNYTGSPAKMLSEIFNPLVDRLTEYSKLNIE